jgi:hypothetical protein
MGGKEGRQQRKEDPAICGGGGSGEQGLAAPTHKVNFKKSFHETFLYPFYTKHKKCQFSAKHGVHANNVDICALKNIHIF